MSNSSTPLITIAMPFKNRCWVLPYVLRSIEQQDYPKKRIKLIFIDNYSTDCSYELLSKWVKAKRNEYYDVVLVRSEGNIPRLRNECLKYSEGTYILFWDSDVVAPPCAVKTLVNVAEHFKDAGAVVATFKYEDLNYVPLIESSRCEDINIREVSGVGLAFTLIRREVFSVIGYFNEFFDVGEDTWFSYALREKTWLKHYRVGLEVLHVKHRDQIIPRATQSMRRWLSFCFYKRAEGYLQSFESLPRHLKIRVFYWLLLPPLIAVSTYVLIAETYLLFRIAGLFALLLYLLASILPLIRELGFVKGIKQWFTFNVPTGIAISYGMIHALLKRFKHIR